MGDNHKLSFLGIKLDEPIFTPVLQFIYLFLKVGFKVSWVVLAGVDSNVVCILSYLAGLCDRDVVDK